MATSKGFNFVFGADTAKFSKAIQSMQKEISKTTSALKNLNTAAKLDPSNTSNYTAQQQALQQQIETTKTKLSRLNEEMKTMVSVSEKTGKAIDGDTWAKYQAEVAKTEEELKKLETQFDKVRTGAQQVSDKLDAAGQKFNDFGSKLKSVGDKISSVGQAILPASVAVAGIGTYAATSATEFEKAMSQVKAISGSTGSEFEALKEKAKELGSSTVYSASDVADAMTDMAKAGWSSQQIMDGMAGVLNAATASGEDLASVSTIVADAITSFKLEAADASHVADVLVEAANSGTIDIADLGESFKNVAPLATSMGFSIEETTVALEALSTSGIKGANAGTGLKSMLSQLVKPSDTVAKALDDLGISIAEDDGKMKSLSQILAEMRPKFADLTEEQQNYYAATIAGRNGVSSLLTLLNMSQDEYDKLGVSLENCSGIATNTAEIMQDNLGSQIELLKNKFEVLSINIGETFIPVLTDIVNKASEMITWFQNLDPSIQQMIINIGLIIAALGPALIIIGQVVSIIGTISSAIGGLLTQGGLINTMITGAITFIGTLTAPMAAVIALIGAIAAAVIYLWNNSEEFRTNITASLDTLLGKISECVNTCSEWLNKLWTETIQPLWENYIKPALEAVAEYLSPFFTTLFDGITTIFGGAFDIIGGLVEFICALLTGDFESAGEGIGTAITGAIDIITGVFETLWGILGPILEPTIGFLVDLFTGFMNTIHDIFDWIKTYIVDPVKEAFETVKEKFEDIKEKIITPIEDAKAKVKDIIDKIKGFFDFDWSLPELKMPHISISGSFSLMPLRVPKFSINWYAKAMNQPYMLDGATIFGAMNGQLLGGGEAGKEVITSADDYFNNRNTTITNNITIVQREGEDSNALANRVIKQIKKQMQTEEGAFA